MDEVSSLQFLTEYLQSKNFEVFNQESSKRFYLTPGDPTLNKKVLAADIGNGLFFCASDSFSTKAQSTSTYCGIFKQSRFQEDIDIKILKRDWFDKFFYRKRIKTKNSYIDSKITVFGSSKIDISQLLSINLIDTFLGIREVIQPLKLTIEPSYIHYLPEIEGNIASIQTNQWLLEEEELDLLISQGSEILRLF